MGFILCDGFFGGLFSIFFGSSSSEIGEKEND